MQPKKKKNEPLKTILVIVCGFLFVFLITKTKWSFYTAFVIALIGAFSEYLSAKIDFLWMKLTWLLGQIVPNILLGAVFYLFLTPIAFLSRIFTKKNSLNLKNTEKSLFKEYNKSFERSSFEKPW